MTKEIWEYIPNYEGLYQVSNKGRVKSFHGEGRIMKIHVNKHRHNYCSVCLSKNGNVSRKKIHRIVAKVFIPNTENKSEVNHKNGIVTDNTVENLEWCTVSENKEHSYRVLKRKPTRARLRAVNVFRDGVKIGCYDSVRQAARKTGSDSSAIVKVCKGKQKHANNLVFEYVDNNTKINSVLERLK